jgi:hypothetical protein
MLQKANDNNACLSFDDRGNPEDVPINNCVVEQKKMFSLLPAGNGCFFIRNGDVRTPPNTGRCLHVENEDAKDVRARGCDQTDQQHWKLYKNPNSGAYNLINQQSGKCLDRDSGGGSDSQAIDCNASEWQWWKLRFIREN